MKRKKLKQPKSYIDPSLEAITEKTLPEITVTTNRRKKLAPLPSLSDLIKPPSLQDYMKSYFRDILNIPRMESPYSILFDNPDIEYYKDGKEGSWTDSYNRQQIVEDLLNDDKFKTILDSSVYNRYRETRHYKKAFNKYKNSDFYDPSLSEDELYLPSYDDWKQSRKGQRVINKQTNYFRKQFSKNLNDIFDSINYMDSYYNTVGINKQNHPTLKFQPGQVFGGSIYNPDKNTITFGMDFGDTPGAAYGIAAHEYAHFVDPYREDARLVGDQAYPKEHRDLYYNSKPDYLNPDSYDDHDKNLWENYADLARNRALMYKFGIYDSRKGMEIPMNAIQKFNKKYGKYSRSFRQFSPEDIYKMHKIIAYNPTYAQDIL